MLTYLFCMIFACQEADKTGFSTSGTGINPNDLGPTEDGGSGSDEDSTGGGGGSGEDLTSGDLEGVDNDDAPFISGVDAFFTEYEGQGDLIDDIEGGSLALSYSNSDTSGSDTISLDSENASANLEAGEVTVLFANVDTAEDYQFRVRLQDVAGNQSNEYTAVAPSSE